MCEVHPSLAGILRRTAEGGQPAIGAMKARTPSRRLASVEDIVHAVLFLMNNRAANGIDLELDAGIRRTSTSSSQTRARIRSSCLLGLVPKEAGMAADRALADCQSGTLRFAEASGRRQSSREKASAPNEGAYLQ